jgi:hypothetical protein
MITIDQPFDPAMRVSAADHPDCALIRPVSTETTLVLQGLNPAQAQELLQGQRLDPLWLPDLQLTLDNHSEAEAEDIAVPREMDLADGKVQLQSGRAGRVEVQAHHALANTLIPQSLNLLMAQQFARSGLMMVHGAALRIDGIGILALGARGSGKSVLSAAALAAGAEIVSDDWLLVGRAEGGRFHAERLREFLMLRHGWATDRLLQALTGLGGRVTPGRVKTVLDIEQQPESVRRRFPVSIALDRAWLLHRPRCGRTARSTSFACSQADALAAIIGATMPLLFGSEFPVESRALMASARGLIADLDWRGIHTGLDLVDQPQRALSGLLAAGVR